MHDFAKPKANKKKQPSGHKLQKALLAILLVLIALTLVLLVVRYQQQKKAKKAKAVVAVAQVQKPQAPTFDFYSLLPKMQVAKSGAMPSAPASTVPAAQKGEYQLQAASLQDADAANTLVARLTLLGMNAKVQSYQQNHITWNRVIVGPFASKAAAQKAQDALSRQKIHAVITQ